MKRLLLVALVVVAAVGTPAAASLVDPHFETNVAEPSVTPGTTQTVDIVLRNVPPEPDDRVRTATDIEVLPRNGSTGFTVHSGRQLVGSLADGESVTLPLRVTVPADAQAGTYRLPLRIRYEVDDDLETETVRATLRVEPRPRLEVERVTADVGIGDSGTVAVAVRNVGTEPARDLGLTLATAAGEVRVGGGSESTRSLGALAPGERASRTFGVTVASTARQQRYALQVAATFEDPDGIERTQSVETVGIRPAPEQSFDVRLADGTIYAGEDGRLRGRVVNEGPEPVRDATVTLEAKGSAIRLDERTVLLGRVPPEAAANFTLPASVSRGVEAGPRVLTATVGYETDDGDRAASESHSLSQMVLAERTRVEVRPLSANVTVDSNARSLVGVENVWDRPLESVTAHASTGPPLSIDSGTGYVGRLEPGESGEVAFGVEVSEDAVATTTAITVNVSGETPDGERVSLGTHEVPVVIVEEIGSGEDVWTVALAVGLALVMLLAGWRWLRI